MNSQQTREFAERLMQEVWLPLDAGAVPRFYRRDMIGYNRKQQLNYDDIVHRLGTDRPCLGALDAAGIRPSLTLQTDTRRTYVSRSRS